MEILEKRGTPAREYIDGATKYFGTDWNWRDGNEGVIVKAVWNDDDGYWSVFEVFSLIERIWKDAGDLSYVEADQVMYDSFDEAMSLVE